MNELVFLKNDGIFTDSRIIAQGTKVAHRRIKETLNRNKKIFENRFGLLVAYQAESTGGRPEEYFYLSEPQATFLITLLKNTETVIEFKATLVQQFYQMRQLLMEKSTQQWIESRYQGKLTRKSETDTIKKLVNYAREQGSEHADKLYIAYSKLANKVAGVQNRDNTTIVQLNNLSLVENIILNVIDEGIKADKHYKDIYKNCKTRLELFKDIAYLNAG